MQRPMNIYLKIACTEENIGPFEVDRNDNIESLKADQGRIPHGMQLLLTSEENQLIANTIEEYDICNDETILFVTTGQVQFHVFLIHHERTITLEVELFDTVDTLKSKIKGTYSNKELKGNCTILKTEISHGDTLYLHIPPMQINIMFVPTSENISVKVKETDTIDYMKAKIQSKIRVPIDKQRVHSCILQMEWFGETTFEGNRSLDCEIKNGDTLYCDFEMKGKLIKTIDISPVTSEMVMISAIMLNGKTVNMEVNTSVTMSVILQSS
ncbi:ubiquitin 8 [Tanacetum coccineum]